MEPKKNGMYEIKCGVRKNGQQLGSEKNKLG